MTTTDLKHLGRKELVELIYEMKKNEEALLNQAEQLKQQVKDLQQQLEDKHVKMSEVGSIAEATVALHGVFEAAQNTADAYLRSIEDLKMETEITLSRVKDERAQILAQAQTEANAVRQEAERYAAAMRQETDATVKEKWDTFQTKVDELLASYSQLSSFLQR